MKIYALIVLSISLMGATCTKQPKISNDSQRVELDSDEESYTDSYEEEEQEDE